MVLEIDINPDYRKFASRWVLFNESDGSGNVDYMGDMLHTSYGVFGF